MTHPFDPDYVVHPGATLAEWFEETHVPRTVATRVYGISDKELDGLLSGRRRLTPMLAGKLERFTSVPARFWLAMEHNFRVGLAAGKHWTPADPHIERRGA